MRRQSSIGSSQPASSSTSSCSSGAPAAANDAGSSAERDSPVTIATRSKPREHVELGDDETGQAVERDGVSRRDRVEPAAAPRPARDGAELAALAAQSFAALVVQLGWKRSGADARAVGLEHADHAADRARPDSEAGARAARDRVRARDVRIRAVADVEQRALRALEQHALAAREPLVNVCDAVDDVRRQSRRAASVASPRSTRSPARRATDRRSACRCARRDPRRRGRCRGRSFRSRRPARSRSPCPVAT